MINVYLIVAVVLLSLCLVYLLFVIRFLKLRAKYDRFIILDLIEEYSRLAIHQRVRYLDENKESIMNDLNATSKCISEIIASLEKSNKNKFKN